MTIAELEQRMVALEHRFTQLETRLPEAPAKDTTEQASEIPAAANFLPGVEYPVVFAKPPARRIHLQAVIRSVRPGQKRLGLSDADWDSLGLEGADE